MKETFGGSISSGVGGFRRFFSCEGIFLTGILMKIEEIYWTKALKYFSMLRRKQRARCLRGIFFLSVHAVLLEIKLKIWVVGHFLLINSNNAVLYGNLNFEMLFFLSNFFLIELNLSKTLPHHQQNPWLLYFSSHFFTKFPKKHTQGQVMAIRSFNSTQHLEFIFRSFAFNTQQKIHFMITNEEEKILEKWNFIALNFLCLTSMTICRRNKFKTKFISDCLGLWKNEAIWENVELRNLWKGTKMHYSFEKSKLRKSTTRKCHKSI